ncbi:phosphoribosylglycinamide formyltransferase [Anaeromassilibacillus sp. An250]|uniref:phosphoribosylglycinamide formyltransferase n=1 Tax=Anaeromassilibacillus sp. An250 TaxID=1965604 RepID=UPI000B38E03F|nr:phosphoribosylglycinamide formyltransferase [Anaeromassilibacillus sp. An250]OUO76310.1 phosphoribosylglycinamide formyltransferase [Anaeromassilibacillus sp. An250]
MLNIAVLVSGGGTNLQALIDAQATGQIQNGAISLVISSRTDAFALERAKKAGIPTRVLLRKGFAEQADYDAALLALLEEFQIQLVVLAGFMTIISETVIRQYENQIINVHPALIPSFCGPGFYGLHVHEAALEKGVKVSGATVHFVNEVCDGGPIILQKAVEVLPDDTPETLQRRIMEQAEWKLLPRAVELFCAGKIVVENGRTRILD